MSRRAASITQADVARVARVARDLGPPWRVEIEGSTIRLTQNPLPAKARDRAARRAKRFSICVRP